MAHKTKIFKLVSGMEVEMRELLLSDESVLAKARASDRRTMTKTLYEIVGRCTMAMVSPGPYPFKEHVEWKRVLAGDFIDAMLQLRMLSYREGNKIQVPDVKCPACRAKFTWEVDIETDLRRQELCAESRDALSAGKPLSTVADLSVGSVRLDFVLGTGETEELYNKLSHQHPGRDMATALRARLVDVVDEGGTKIERRDIVDWLDGGVNGQSKYQGLTSDDAEFIRDLMDQKDAGIDLQVEARCPESDCGSPVYFDLPFDNIFLPSTGIKKRKVERRAQDKSSEV